MVIGIPKEIMEQECRVGMLPSGAKSFVKRGHRVLVESGAGVGAGANDEDYLHAGAEIRTTHEQVFEEAELLVKVKEPQVPEYSLIRPNHILFAYLHLAANKILTSALQDSGATCIACETVEINHRFPLLEPMSEIAGRMSIVVGGFLLSKERGGKGILLGGAPGVRSGRVAVLGGGTAGMNAARAAIGLGADVTILEVDIERMRFLDITIPEAHTRYSDENSLPTILPEIDLLIGAVLAPASKTPKLISRSMLKLMEPGSVFVDIAIDQGGCAETSHLTTHHKPIFIEEGIIHYCVANMPGAYPRTSTQAFTNATSHYVETIADFGVNEATRRLPELAKGINVVSGHIVCKAVATTHGLEHVALEDIPRLT